MELKIGKRIQDLRKQKGLTQEQVAAALNISAAAVSKWETDTTYPDGESGYTVFDKKLGRRTAVL